MPVLSARFSIIPCNIDCGYFSLYCKYKSALVPCPTYNSVNAPFVSLATCLNDTFDVSFNAPTVILVTLLAAKITLAPMLTRLGVLISVKSAQSLNALFSIVVRLGKLIVIKPQLLNPLAPMLTRLGALISFNVEH